MGPPFLFALIARPAPPILATFRRGEESMSLGVILLAAIVIIGGYLVYAYNALIKNKNLVAEGWSGIDVQLRRRADLIPNLVETVKGYAAHEDKLLRDTAKLGAQGRS